MDMLEYFNREGLSQKAMNKAQLKKLMRDQDIPNIEEWEFKQRFVDGYEAKYNLKDKNDREYLITCWLCKDVPTGIKFSIERKKVRPQYQSCYYPNNWKDVVKQMYLYINMKG